MTTDPATYILAAGLVSFCIGFMAAAVLTSRRIRDAFDDGWKSGVRCARDTEPRL